MSKRNELPHRNFEHGFKYLIISACHQLNPAVNSEPSEKIESGIVSEILRDLRRFKQKAN